MPTFGSRVGYYLPIVIERLALCKSRNDNCNKCYDEEPPDELETSLIRLFPDLACKTFEELGYGEFGSPEALQTLSLNRLNYGGLLLTT